MDGSGDRYRVDDVVTVRGAPVAGVAAGWHMNRHDRAEDEVAAPKGALVWQGSTQHLQYTDGQQQAELARVSNTGKSFAAGAVALLIPITKSESWWALPLAARAAHYRTGEGLSSPVADGGRVEGHTAIGARFADRIFRRLYHARYLPGASWDFLTYFEMHAEDAPAFRQLLAELRDPAVNPEWRYVDREVEIWTTRL